jgi:tetratricopeptide (TPR) repeat protein
MFNLFKKSQPSPETLIPQARTLIGQGKLTEAMDIYNRLIAAHPTSATCYADRGTALAMCGQLQPAIADLEKAIQLGYQHSSVYTSLATARMQMGDQVGALANFGAAVALDSNNALIYYNRATLLATMGKREDALADLRKCLTFDPNEAFETAIQGKINALTQEP